MHDLPPPSRPKDKIEVAVHPPPRVISSLVTCSAKRLRRKKGAHTVTHGAPDRTKSSQPEGARGFVFPPHSSGDQLWSECVELGDAAAINMRQRVRVSDSCTVEQGHAVLALSERAAPKKANPVWRH